ncbi:cytochrome P450 [Chloroflexi bacterium TSY]|nr:cytochrome P450 [Chloroflexi bacterium TSY]
MIINDRVKSTSVGKRLPITSRLPLLGSVPQLITKKYDFFLEMNIRHGDIHMLNLGILKLIMLNHPEHAQHVLVDHRHNYDKKGPLWDAGRKTLGANSLAMIEGRAWLSRRRMMQPHFHKRRLAMLVDFMLETIDEALLSWDEKAQSGKPFDVHMAFPIITMKVILKTLFGSTITDQVLDEMSRDLKVFVESLGTYTMLERLPSWLPISLRDRCEQAIQNANDKVFELVTQKRQAGEIGNDLISMLLETIDEESGEQMTEQQLRDEAIVLFVAGYETTALALSWAIYLLTHHLDKMHILQTEIDMVLKGNKPSFSDLPSLSYTRMVFQEALRLYPSTWYINRRAVEDDQIDGFHIPANTVVICSMYGIHHNPNVWQNPELFEPERFTPERMIERHNLAWMPFGAGPHLCIGNEFAIMEAQLVLARILQRYKVTAMPCQTLKPKLANAMVPEKGIFVKLEKRLDW